MARKIRIALVVAEFSSFNCRCCRAASWGPNCTLTCHFSRSICCVWARDQSTQCEVSPDPISVRNVTREKLWREFFSDPSQWCDHRSEKSNPRYPDFKHKRTGVGLWLDNKFTPPWVEAELGTIAPSVLQSHIFSWNVRLRRHLKAEDYKTTLTVYEQMLREGVAPDTFTFVHVLNACSSLRSLEEGRHIHNQIIEKGCESDLYVATCLVDMYAKCGNIEDAWRVFNKMQERDAVSWNAIIGGYVKSEQGLKALDLFQTMQQEGVDANNVTFVGVLNACASVVDLEQGRRVHEQIIRRGCQSDVYVASCLVDMYAKCGSIKDAWGVFNKMPERDVVCWSAMIVGYVKSDQGLKALELFRQMQQEGVKPDIVAFVGALNACASIGALEEGRRVHEQILQRGCESDMFVANCLIDMYAKCGSINDAQRVFDKMQERDVVCWNAMILGYVKSEQGLKALELFRIMQQVGMEPNTVTFMGVLNGCASVAAIEEGRSVHEEIIRRGYQFDIYVASCLVDMYAKCGSIKDAWSVFNKMGKRDVVCWSVMIVGYVKSEQALKALELFQKMQQEGVDPDPVSFVGALNACASIGALEEGRRVHEQIIQRGYQSDIYVTTCLIDMYAKCGSIEDAWSTFNKMQERDVVSWNAMIAGYVKSNQGLKAWELFNKMQQELVEPNTGTFVGVLNACASVAALEEGRSVHEQIIGRGCQSDVYVASCLVDMYAKCGSIDDAWTVFNKMRERDVVCWSAMIVGYVKSDQGLKGLELFRQMQQEGVEPDLVSFGGALNACASVGALEEGRRVHEQIIRRGCELDVYVATCLVDMYAKCGTIEDAQNVFNKMREHDVVCWNAMIVGYVKSKQGLKSLKLYKEMLQEGIEPNTATFVGVLNACASVAALEEGRSIHKQIMQRGFQSDVYIASCLIDMYAKCGSIKDARCVFHNMRERNVVSWSAMVGGLAMHGHSKKAIGMFKRMGKEGIEINHVTFTSLLSACSHGGLVKEGLRYFNSMTSDYNVTPTREHYACMVDLLGRAGRLEEAEKLTKRIPMGRDTCVLMSLLGACRIHSNVKIAERTAKRCWKVDPGNASAHVLLSNIYAATGKLDRSAAMENRRFTRKVGKKPGRTWIAVNNLVHSFAACGKEHPELLQIHAELVRFSVQIKEAGYISETRFVSHEKKKELFYCQGEKLPIAYRIISMPRGTPLHIKKNYSSLSRMSWCHQIHCKYDWEHYYCGRY